MGVGGQRHDPAALSPGKSPDTTVQEAGRASGPVWTGKKKETKFHARPGFEPRCVQPVASRYTDYTNV